MNRIFAALHKKSRRQAGMAAGEVIVLLVPLCVLCMAGASRLAATSSARLRGQWEVAARAQRDFGIIHAFAACEYFFGPDDRLAGYNLLPCDFSGKIDYIQLMLREYGIGPNDWVFVGDGLNDVPIARAAPISVGYRPHPALREVVTYVIDDFAQLNSLLH